MALLAVPISKVFFIHFRPKHWKHPLLILPEIHFPNFVVEKNVLQILLRKLWQKCVVSKL